MSKSASIVYVVPYIEIQVEHFMLLPDHLLVEEAFDGALGGLFEFGGHEDNL